MCAADERRRANPLRQDAVGHVKDYPSARDRRLGPILDVRNPRCRISGKRRNRAQGSSSSIRGPRPWRGRPICLGAGADAWRWRSPSIVAYSKGFAAQEFLSGHTLNAERLRRRAPLDFRARRRGRGVPEGDLRHLAELYAVTSPAVIRCGWGLERNRNGGNAALAILALPAVAGKFGVRGGGYSMSNSAAWGIVRPWLGVEPATRVVNMNHLWRALTEYDAPPVKMLFVYNCNPAATMPDQHRVLTGLAREDLFTIVFDQVATDTAAFADVVLPATTFLEACDFARVRSAESQLVRPVIDAVSESAQSRSLWRAWATSRAPQPNRPGTSWKCWWRCSTCCRAPWDGRCRTPGVRLRHSASDRFSSWTCCRARIRKSISFRPRSGRSTWRTMRSLPGSGDGPIPAR